MRAALTRDDAILARLSPFGRQIARAREHIARALATAEPWYVAFSGGKDSLVVLALVAEQRPGVTAIWTDDELEHDEQLTYIPATCAQLGARLVVKTGTQLHGGWFRSWSDPPFWRDVLPGTVVTRESVRVLAPRWGYSGVFLGLRADESKRRVVHLRSRGVLFRNGDGLWQSSPLAGWSADDVWAAIAALGLPYQPVYDRLAAIGVERRMQRVGPLPLCPGWVLARGWPEQYARLVARYGPRWED